MSPNDDDAAGHPRPHLRCRQVSRDREEPEKERRSERGLRSVLDDGCDDDDGDGSIEQDCAQRSLSLCHISSCPSGSRLSCWCPRWREEGERKRKRHLHADRRPRYRRTSSSAAKAKEKEKEETVQRSRKHCEKEEGKRAKVTSCLRSLRSLTAFAAVAAAAIRRAALTTDDRHRRRRRRCRINARLSFPAKRSPSRIPAAKVLVVVVAVTGAGYIECDT